ncbi:hypothetical protein WSM22_00170 [Cytophagales bacterium WSM2-2]|nr:hypothetical protein WSM22_00170 [Cytophagales bacterium WSM2-2]
MVDFEFGTRLVHLVARQMKRLSHKDLIIALGILVAAVIIITSVYAKDSTAETKVLKVVPEKKVKPAAVIHKALQKLSSRASF